MTTLRDRLQRLEFASSAQVRYRVQWQDGGTTTETDIVWLLALSMQPDKCKIVSIEPLHAPPYNILEKLAAWYLEQHPLTN